MSMLPPADAANHSRTRDNLTVGDKRSRDGQRVVQPAASDEPHTSPDNAAHTVLFPMGEGGYTETPAACSRRHYVQKMLGSVAHVYSRAKEFL
jgi:hypothetical protein